ncbi:MAG: nucleotidyltransferase domain-containing protein [Sulfuricaulis sp.]
MSNYETGSGSIPAETAGGARAGEIKRLIQRELRRMAPALRGYRIYLFGSRASGTARERSDFDVGVLGEQPLPLKTFYKIEDIFDDLPTLYRIDWVDLNRASPEFRDRALRRTVILYE